MMRRTWRKFTSKSPQNPYKILQIDEKSDSKTIKSQFYKLSQLHHPDKGGDSNKFMEVKEAYEMLSNPERRREFDQHSVYAGFKNSRQHRTEMYTSNLNPNDYILYRRNSGNRPGFDYQMHFEKHYGSKTKHDSLYYKELYERKSLKPYKIFLLAGFGFMLYFSDLIQVMIVK